MPPRITRRTVVQWLDQVSFQLDQMIRGPAGEFRARVALLQQKIKRWKDELGGGR